MLKNILLILGITSLVGCQLDSKTESSIESTQLTKDSINNIKVKKESDRVSRLKKTNDSIVSILAFRELKIYPLQHHERFSFVPLTDMYPWSEHKDSLAIEDKHLYFDGTTRNDPENHHTLSSKYRARFFNRLNIKETDTLFLYNFNVDSIIVKSISDTRLIAFISPYSTYHEKIEQYDYYIGFEIEDNTNANLAYIGDLNPFNTGDITGIEWEEIKINDLPTNMVSPSDSLRYLVNTPLDAYQFKRNNLEYYVQSFGDNKITHTRCVVVIDSSTKNIIFKQFYYESEGSYLLPLINDENWSGKTSLQWTGNLFKHKSDIIFGFSGYSFGCEGIQFLNQIDKPIRIHCDNRH